MSEQDCVTDATVTINGEKYRMNSLSGMSIGRCDDCDLKAYCLRNKYFGDFCLDMAIYCNFKKIEKDIKK